MSACKKNKVHFTFFSIILLLFSYMDLYIYTIEYDIYIVFDIFYRLYLVNIYNTIYYIIYNIDMPVT